LVDTTTAPAYDRALVSIAPGARRRQPEIRPDQILDAAEALILEGGPAAMTMGSVAAAAGVGKGTIYHYYRSKSELLSALRARYLGRTVAAAERSAAEPPELPALERVERFLDALLAVTGRNGPLIWALFHQSPIEEDDELAAIHGPLLALVRRGADSGEFTLADPSFTTAFILHGLHGTVEAAFHRGEVDATRLRSGLHQAIRSLLTPSPSSCALEP
jgi:AcrR family transcriptional regulator